MKLAIRNIRHITLLMMVTAFSLEMSAQWNFDIVSVEAYINDLKRYTKDPEDSIINE